MSKPIAVYARIEGDALVFSDTSNRDVYWMIQRELGEKQGEIVKLQDRIDGCEKSYVKLANDFEELRWKVEKYEDLIQKAIPYVRSAGNDAEVRHDNRESEYYMDGAQFEIMKETELWLETVEGLLE